MDSKNKWMGGIGQGKREGALHRALGIPEGEKIPTSKLRAVLKRLQAIEKHRRLTASELKLLRMIIAALNMREAQLKRA